MFQKYFALGLLTLLGYAAQAQLFSTQTGKVSFFSSTPMENIQAESNSVLAVMNAATGDLAFSIQNGSFHFENKLMEEHFNEKYMETEKYPTSTFKGKINEKVDLTKDGRYEVTVTGKLAVHGVSLDRTLQGMVVIKEGKIQLLSAFKVRNVDHKIEIPTLVNAKIAEEIEVSVDAILSPKK